MLGSSFLGVYAHSGFLNGLTKSGFCPARFAGSSAGALAGALFCGGLRGDELKVAATSNALRHSFADLGCLWRLPGVLTSFWSSGIFHGQGLVKHLRNLLGDIELESLPLDIAVTDVKSSRSLILREGPLAESVMASCAVPGLFTIQEVDGDRYLDGGIGAELPFDHLLDDPDIDTIILHRIRHEPKSGPNVNWETVANAVGVAHHTACNELHELRVERCRAMGKKLIEADTITPFPGFFSGRRAPECYELGFNTGQQLAGEL